MSEFESILQHALGLPEEKRALLAERLLHSLKPPEDPEIKAAWVAEVCRRDEEIRSGKVKTIPAEEVMRKVRARLRK